MAQKRMWTIHTIRTASDVLAARKRFIERRGE